MSFWLQLIIAFLSVLLGLLPTTGCDSPLKTVSNDVTAVFDKALQKADFATLEARADVSSRNPTYRAKGFFGSGFYYDAQIGLEGLEIAANVEGQGTGNGTPTPEEQARLEAILTSPTFGQQLGAALLEKFKAQKAASQPADPTTSQPASPAPVAGQ